MKEGIQLPTIVVVGDQSSGKSSANIIAKCLPDIVRKINEKLKASVSELNKIPRRLLSVAEVMAAFMGIIGSSKESLRKILLSIRNLVNKEMEKEIVTELLGTGGGVAIEKLFVESPTVASKREKLNTSINLPRESQEVMANIMDEIATAGD
ncbi:hypothetical protein D5086_024940 [Populus alba]|uniref:Uncharacterized protein n=1 Tax=Populus alba TaxID=43335 RepID=A0ACC4B8H3_POPAL